MPAWSIPVKDPTGRVVGIACGRGRRTPPCKTCKAPEAKLACDGCDEQVCAPCAVSPGKDLDFCPACAKAPFEHWKANEGGERLYREKGRAVGRIAFRAWAKKNRVQFMALAKPRSEDSLKEVP